MESCDIHGAQDRLAPGIQLATWPSSDRPTWLVFMFSQTFLFRKGKRRKGREAFRQLRTHRGREQLADKETQRESLSVKTILRCPEWKTNVLTSPACVRFHQKADITTAVSFLPTLDILSLQNCLLQKTDWDTLFCNQWTKFDVIIFLEFFLLLGVLWYCNALLIFSFV